MTSGDPSSQPPNDREVRIARTIGGPRELVFRAFVDPDQVAEWWAPDGFEVPRESVAVEPGVGGHIHFTMAQSGGGPEYPVRFEIVEFVEPELLVFTSPAMPEVGILVPTRTRVTFEADGDSTRVTVTQGPHTDEMARSAEAGWQGSFDKLDALFSS
jgi:uncharacterized protein YndB with AHSA1/START domain